MDPLHIYSGIFLREPGQTLLAASMSQIEQTLGAAWKLAQGKQHSDEVFAKCLAVVEGCNDAFFEEEAKMVFLADAQASSCLRTCFVDYGKQMVRESQPSQVQLRITIPSESTFVKLLLLAAARKPFIASGAFFRSESPLEKKDAVMDCVRSAFGTLRDEYILEEPLQKDVPEPLPFEPDEPVAPDDSVSNVGSSKAAKSKSSSSSSSSDDSSSHVTHKSVTMASHRKH